jgi:hypothetical protein
VVGEGAEGAAVGLEGGEGAAAEAFVTRLELFEHVEAGSDLGLSTGEPSSSWPACWSSCWSSRRRAWRSSTVPRLARTPAFSASTSAWNSTMRCSRRARSSSSWIFSEESFSRRVDVGLFLEVEGGHLVADAGEVLGGGEGFGLGLAQGELFLDEFLFDAGGRPAFLELWRSSATRAWAPEAFGDRRQFLFGGERAFLGLGDFGEGAGVLLVQFAEAFLVELDAAVLAVGLGLEFGSALLGAADLVFEFGEPLIGVGGFRPRRGGPRRRIPRGRSAAVPRRFRGRGSRG